MSLRRERRRCLAAIALCAFAIGCGRSPAPTPPPRTIGEVQAYKIGVADVLDVRVWKNPELTVRGLQVRADGMISVPLLDDVQAEGLTPEELKDVLTQAWSEYILAPDVTVIVEEMNSNSVAIVGGVSRAGVIPLQRNTRVLEAIAHVGGFSTFAKKNKVKILRDTPAGQVEYHFDYDDFISGKAPDSNILLEPGDTIVVPD